MYFQGLFDNKKISVWEIKMEVVFLKHLGILIKSILKRTPTDVNSL